ncbi:urease accessory protein UreF [Nitrospira lenta]|uniref:Urease accessory protein UreF n=1 Tax=Nitrospira lenta TaxID=1436998 RepID=A0A0K2GXI1_9BACT|nr:urease accessory UreF family protein [Nitrospira lenta]ALA66373.1 putative urease accessory protein UreF [Nitrospira lenta]SPP64263.1 putative urease accessory protein UreF [Nitrospira lenta]
MNTRSLLTGLRFVDSFFPSGGYAYSSGLEAAVQGGAVKTSDDLARFVTESLTAGIGEREAVAVGMAHRAFISGILEPAMTADHELDAMKLGYEGRMASRQMGRQVIRLAAEQNDRSLLIEDYQAAVEADETPGHIAVAMGLTLAAAGWSKTDSIAAFLYQVATGYVAAAMKLIPVGQREGQRLLDGWLEVIERVSRQAAEPCAMRSWSPVQDIYAMRHSRLESRLFRS